MGENTKIMTIHWEITPECNYNCIHCYNYWRHNKNDNSFGYVSKADYDLIADEIIDIKPDQVVITGGEPLLEFDKIKHYIKKIVRTGINISINTNASLINEEIASFLVEYGVGILVSLPCSVPEINDLITNTNDSFLKTERGIKNALEYNVCIGLNMVVSNVNKNYIIETARYVSNDLGIKNFYVTKVGKPLNSSEEFKKYEIGIDGLRKIFDDLMEIKCEFDMEVDSLIAYPHCSIPTSDSLLLLGGQRSCTAGRTSVAVGIDGSVRACVRVEKTYGNLSESSIAASWNRMSEWRDGTLLPEDCKECKNEANCSGACRAEAYAVNGSLNAIDPCADLTNYRFIESSENKEGSCNFCASCVCFDVLSLWNLIYPYLDQAGTVFGIVGSTVGFGVWVKNKFGRKYEPRDFFKLICEKEYWNAHELAEKLDITDEESKKLLVGIGYKWNKTLLLYCKTEVTDQLLNRIRQ